MPVVHFHEIVLDELLKEWHTVVWNDPTSPRYYHGDKVTVYDGDLWHKPVIATVIRYNGMDKQKHGLYLVEFKGGARSAVREEWLKPYEPPVMTDTRDYLEALNDVQGG